MANIDYDLVIIGSGPAGLSAGLYAGRYKLKTLIIGAEFGGEAARAGVIWNYPGVMGVDGYELLKVMKLQAEEVGASVISGKVTGAEKIPEGFRVVTTGRAYTAKTIIFAQGAERMRLGLSKEKELTGNGVHYCATCDSPAYAGEMIAFVGGGSASVKGAIMASEYAKKIFMIIREPDFMAEPALVDELKKLGSKIEFLFETEVWELLGEKELMAIKLSDGQELKTKGLFVEIGSTPNNEISQMLGVTLDKSGYLETDSYGKTNVPGLFGAGDTTNLFKDFKQIITASATGSASAYSAYKFIKNIR